MHTHISKFLLILLSLSLLSACKTAVTTTKLPTTKLDTPTRYRHAITDAMSPSPAKICDSLWAISPNNQQLIRKDIAGEEYILMLSWKGEKKWYEPSLDTFYNTGGYEIWVTAAPQLKQRLQGFDTTQLDLRIKQLLGLPPNGQYRYFIEFWVRAKDLFRPCPDAEINDSQCSLCFPGIVDSSYVDWINQGRIDRYYNCELYQNYPWTQLGYTYDWSTENPSHIGLSEFVIRKNSKVWIKSISKTKKYLAE